MEINYKDWYWQDKGSVEVSSDIFEAVERKDLIHKVIRWQRNKARSGTHASKGISDISGTTRKPYAQKKTGRARQGSLRSPQFRGGAVIFGPQPREHGHKLNKKIRRFASISTISSKLKDGLFHVVENYQIPFEKTGKASEWVNERGFKSVLFVVSDDVRNPALENAFSNLYRFDILPVKGFNVLDAVKHEHIICDLSSLKQLENRYSVNFSYEEEMNEIVANEEGAI